MTELMVCPCCNSNSFEKYLQCKDHSISQELFEIKQCTTCNLLVTSPRPEDDFLSDYYQSDKYISHSNTSRGIINKLYHIVRKFTLNGKINLLKSLLKNSKLLDIGSGAGYFLNHCKMHSIEAYGIEPDVNTRNKSIHQFNIKVYDEQKLASFEDLSFNIITLWHVLEHVGNLPERLDQIEKLLMHDGYLIIAVPNCSSFDASFYKSYWAGYDVPRHLWHFTPDTLNQMVSNYGFKLHSIKPMYFDSFYVSMLSEQYRDSLFPSLGGTLIGLLSNLTALIKNNNTYSSQIYIFTKVGSKINV